MPNTKFLDNKENMPIFIYLKSIFSALLITVVIMLIIAAIITFTSVTESIMPLVTSIIMVLSIAYSGLLSATRLRKRGFIHGLITGAIYTILILFFSWIFINNFSLDKFVIIKGTIGIASGGIGGMIGVNLK